MIRAGTGAVPGIVTSAIAISKGRRCSTKTPAIPWSRRIFGVRQTARQPSSRSHESTHAATIVFHRVSFDFNRCWISLGHLSASYCILRSRKTSRPRPSAPSVPPLREAASSARDCTQPVDGTGNPLRGNAERFSLQASPFIIQSLFPPQRQSHDDYASVGKYIVESVA